MLTSRTVNHGFEFIIVSLFLACLPRGRLIMGLSLLLLVYFLRAYLAVNHGFEFIIVSLFLEDG